MKTTFNDRVGLAYAPNTPVVLNEFMAANTRTLADPQGAGRVALRLTGFFLCPLGFSPVWPATFSEFRPGQKPEGRHKHP